MLDVIKRLFSSTKFWLTIAGSAVCGGLTYAGAPAELIAIVAGLFGINVVGQGLADFGKNKTK